MYLSMVEQVTFLSLEVKFENMVMSMLIINPDCDGTGRRDLILPARDCSDHEVDQNLVTDLIA